MNKVSKVFAAGVLLAASSAPLIANAGVNLDVNIGLPGFSTYVAPAPSYYYPPAVYYAPPPAYYYPPARYYAPPPTYYYPPERYYVPRPVYRHDRWDQRSERRWDHEYRHEDRRRR
jgi:hypothetical protein